ADRNRSHWSTSKTPSYTKSVSWQHHQPRLPASILVHENSYQPLDKGALAQYDEQLAEYYLTRGSNNRRDNWSDHIRRTIIKESRPFILDYLHKQGWATR
ncbi:hypothetical protein P2O48_02565, partial [Escherichia coli]